MAATRTLLVLMALLWGSGAQAQPELVDGPSSPEAAPTPTQQPTPPSPPTRPPTTRSTKSWYGWQILIGDLAAGGVALYSVLNEDLTAGIISGLLYVANGPIFHLAYGYPRRALFDGGVRICTPVLFGYLASRIGEKPCEDDESKECIIGWALGGVLVGMGVGMIYDLAASTRTVPVVPAVGASHAGTPTWGVAGVF